MNLPLKVFTLAFLCSATFCIAQAPAQFTFEDSIRGGITSERAWRDLTFYALKVKVDPVTRTIQGSNTIRYRVLQPGKVLQVDLQPPLQVDKIVQDDGQELHWQLQGQNAYFVNLSATQTMGENRAITVFYSGKPKVAPRAPWDGGFTWSFDTESNPFAATSCQGLGASVWWPCKDHMYDEPDSMDIAVTVPAALTDVSNGRLRSVSDNPDGTKTFDWYVKNPINNYGVNLNIARYAHFSDTYAGEKGNLSLDYYVLPANLEKAKKQFQQVNLMLAAFEHWFGPYPFYEDGYKLVQAPYLGMEHQSCVTYGNGFENGYLRMDLSGTGWGLKWDYILVHESGHEWFANNITYKDIADMWIHEGFTTYSECLYTEYHFGKEAGAEYVRGLRSKIGNDNPIIGVYGVNNEGSGDMYFKGANMLHMIRQIVDDDEKWRSILRGLNRDFYHQTVDTKQIETYLSEKSGTQLGKVFDQYLRTAKIPDLEYKLKKGNLSYRWTNCVEGFDMPVKVTLEPGKFAFIYPTMKWKKTKCKAMPVDFKVDENFYIGLKN